VAHESPLALRPGGDRLLEWLLALAGAAGVLAIGLSPADGRLRAALAGVCITFYVLTIRRLRAPVGDLLLYPDGRASLNTPEGSRREGVAARGAWLTPKYAVIAIVMRSGRHRLLVSRSRQATGDFRVLRAWLRLGFPTGGEQS